MKRALVWVEPNIDIFLRTVTFLALSLTYTELFVYFWSPMGQDLVVPMHEGGGVMDIIGLLLRIPIPKVEREMRWAVEGDGKGNEI